MVNLKKQFNRDYIPPRDRTTQEAVELELWQFWDRSDGNDETSVVIDAHHTATRLIKLIQKGQE